MITPIEMINKQLTLTATDTSYTADTRTQVMIKSAIIVNTTATAYTATIYKIPSGGAAGATNTIISAKSIAPGEAYICDELVGQILEAGDALQGIASSAAKLNFIVSGIVIS